MREPDRLVVCSRSSFREGGIAFPLIGILLRLFPTELAVLSSVWLEVEVGVEARGGRSGFLFLIFMRRLVG